MLLQHIDVILYHPARDAGFHGMDQVPIVTIRRTFCHRNKFSLTQACVLPSIRFSLQIAVLLGREPHLLGIHQLRYSAIKHTKGGSRAITRTVGFMYACGLAKSSHSFGVVGLEGASWIPHLTTEAPCSRAIFRRSGLTAS